MKITALLEILFIWYPRWTLVEYRGSSEIEIYVPGKPDTAFLMQVEALRPFGVGVKVKRLAWYKNWINWTRWVVQP